MPCIVSSALLTSGSTANDACASLVSYLFSGSDFKINGILYEGENCTGSTAPDGFYVYSGLGPTIYGQVTGGLGEITLTGFCSSLSTQTPTPTPTQTPTQTPTESYDIYLFEDCSNSSNQFRFQNVPGILSVGEIYSITGPYFNGVATVISYSATGVVYSSAGSVFIGQVACPTSTPTPTVTPTPTKTTTPTPTPSLTTGYVVTGCPYSQFCFRTDLSSLSGYSGNYTVGSVYNGLPTYSGDGTTVGVIYYYSSVTDTYWCLSNSLGGTCYLKGASPCKSDCPDISANDFTTGICPTPTPTPINCLDFDFTAYFDCDWEPLPTPTPSVDCNDVDFTFNTFGVTPTPSQTGNLCNNVGILFSMSAYTPNVTPTVTLTPSVTLTKTVDAQGQVTFQMLDETFNCVSVKVLVDCQTGEIFYVTNGLVFENIPVVIGMTMLADINGVMRCVTYTSDNDNISSNANVGSITQIYSICSNCNTIPTPTPTITSTPSQTPTTTTTLTSTPTPTTTPTLSYGSTPLPTPSITPSNTATSTMTPTQTPTPTTTPNYVYVFESCSIISPNTKKTQIIQNLPVSFVNIGEAFKDDMGNCWNYVGRYDSTNYIPPVSVLAINYNGNYFVSSPTLTYKSSGPNTACQVCETQCVSVSDSLYSSTTAYCNDIFGNALGVGENVYHRTVVTLNGIATSTITVTINYLVTYDTCGSGGTPFNVPVDIVINAGQSSAYYEYASKEYAICPQTFTTCGYSYQVYNGVKSINGATECPAL